ncbi:MAG TPA: DNA double-strand break repair nuclease NurA [Anaerolineaceae bacterium]|nr:DNA double-strand break repair nuclease NurA [Anaerolineaceae bacterium]
MPLNHLDLQNQIQRFSRDELLAHENAEKQLVQASTVLEHVSHNIEAMRKVGEVATTRTAIPTTELPNQAFRNAQWNDVYNLVCADGSQIMPDPHSSPIFALLNIGIIRIPAEKSKAIHPVIITDLYQRDRLYIKNQLIGEDIIALDRDVLELRYLYENCQELKGTTIALRDGLLELYHEPRSDNAFQERLQTYYAYLQSFRSAELSIAGYVDKPRSQMVVELLRLCVEMEEKAHSENTYFPDINDRLLFEQRLKNGERSAIFENFLPKNDLHGTLAPFPFYFFYLNVSQNEKPWIVRVEIPEWVASDKARVEVLHSALLEQCAIMGTKPYPYCLHRAHETALVRQAEKEELARQIQAMQLKEGLPLDEKSYKQSAKDHTSRRIVER